MLNVLAPLTISKYCLIELGLIKGLWGEARDTMITKGYEAMTYSCELETARAKAGGKVQVVVRARARTMDTSRTEVKVSPILQWSEVYGIL